MVSLNLIGIRAPWNGSICNGATGEKAEMETVCCSFGPDCGAGDGNGWSLRDLRGLIITVKL